MSGAKKASPSLDAGGKFAGRGALATSDSSYSKGPKSVPDSEWRRLLPDSVYQVARMGGTEPAFSGAYDRHLKAGRYNCVCCGARLFVSSAKFYSGCGWPAFHTAAADGGDANVVRLRDESHGMHRVEVRCKQCDAHLGHVFDDGPEPTGERYCINSACLDFEPDGGKGNVYSAP